MRHRAPCLRERNPPWPLGYLLEAAAGVIDHHVTSDHSQDHPDPLRASVNTLVAIPEPARKKENNAGSKVKIYIVVIITNVQRSTQRPFRGHAR